LPGIADLFLGEVGPGGEVQRQAELPVMRRLRGGLQDGGEAPRKEMHPLIRASRLHAVEEAANLPIEERGAPDELLGQDAVLENIRQWKCHETIPENNDRQ
jgi:hypothetical protein